MQQSKDYLGCELFQHTSESISIDDKIIDLEDEINKIKQIEVIIKSYADMHKTHSDLEYKLTETQDKLNKLTQQMEEVIKSNTRMRKTLDVVESMPYYKSYLDSIEHLKKEKQHLENFITLENEQINAILKEYKQMGEPKITHYFLDRKTDNTYSITREYLVDYFYRNGSAFNNKQKSTSFDKLSFLMRLAIIHI